MTDKQASSPVEVFERALGAILARVSVSGSSPGDDSRTALAVAFSGGLDSSVLLHLAHAYAGSSAGGARVRLLAFHVHHGLSPHADSWLRHGQEVCARLGVALHTAHVDVPRNGDGIEQGARLRRYEALGKLCSEHGVSVLLTAHHLDDQAETVLLQLLRGSGVAGMSGMEAACTAPGLLGTNDVVLGRPLLGLRRAVLESYARDHLLSWIDDESNLDLQYPRNALRHAVMPELARHFPGYQQRLSRAAAHARSARRLLDEIAEEDLARCVTEDGAIQLNRIPGSPDRAANLLRHWFASRNVRMPSTAWLEQMLRQATEAREDAQVRVVHPDCEVHRHRGRLYLIARIDDAALQVAPARFRWQGEATLRFPSYDGTLHVSVGTEEGRAWLAAQQLELRYRGGGEVLKPAPNRPGRSLKHHYQALDIPAWERRRLPLLTADDRLLFAAGIGMNHAVLPAGSAIRIEWRRGLD